MPSPSPSQLLDEALACAECAAPDHPRLADVRDGIAILRAAAGLPPARAIACYVPMDAREAIVSALERIDEACIATPSDERIGAHRGRAVITAWCLIDEATASILRDLPSAPASTSPTPESR